MFEARKAEVGLSITDVIEGMISDFAQASCRSAGPGTLDCLRLLRSHSLWPVAKVLRDQSLCTIFSSMMSIQNPTSDHCGTVFCQCKKSRPDVRERLRDWREKILKEGVGICLDCVATERGSLRQNTCRVKHT